MVHTSKRAASVRKLKLDVIPIFKESILQEQEVEVEGRIVLQQVYKVVDPVQRVGDCRAVDFCLNNQIAVGSFENLTPSSYSGDTAFSFADKILQINPSVFAPVAAPDNE